MALKRAQLLFFVTLMLLFMADVFAKDIYMWRDENGVLVFSDTKRPGARLVSLAEDKHSANRDSAPTILDLSKNPQELKYGVKIVSPHHEETIRDNTGSLHVAVRITPTFNPRFKVQLLFNGKRLPQQNKSVFVMRNITNGAHTLQVQLFDQEGKLIATSEQSTFFMFRSGDTE